MEGYNYADNGLPEFQNTCLKYMRRVYGIDYLSEKNVMHGIGSKPILAMLPMCFINPGDVTLMTVPGYPVLGTYTKYLGGEVYNLPLLEENNFYPDLDTIPDEILEKAKLLYINYPNNPAEQVAEYLIREASIITVPWDDAGHYLRFSVTFEAEDEEDETGIINEIEKRLKGLELEF